MKPREQLSQTKAQARGLARWGWIKAYLDPAIKYIGISGNDFDRIFIGGDQILKELPSDAAPAFPQPDVTILGVTYTPTGDAPAADDTSDGYWYLEWQWTPTVTDYDPSGSPPLYYWSGAITMNTPPRFRFVATEIYSDSGDLDKFSASSGVIGWTRILLASRTSGVISNYVAYSTIINVLMNGFDQVTVTII